MTNQKSLAERQAIIDRIKKTQTNDFLADAIASGLNPAFDFAWTDLSGVDLSGADLRWTDLEGVNFENVNFRDRHSNSANLKGAFLRGAFLSGVDLQGIDLDNANLSFADFSNADLRNKGLWNANLQDANLTNANLDGAYLRRANLKNANLSGASLDWSHERCNLERANLTGANLSHASLSYVEMDDACLMNADMEGIHLSGYVSLRRANLSGSWLVDAYLRGADLEKADLTDANLSGVNLSGNCLVRAKLSGLRLVDADLEEADLTNADLSGTDLSGANLSQACLVGADLSGANLHRANLSDAYLNCADLRFANLVGANLVDANLTEVYLCGATLDDPECEYLDLKEDISTEELTDEAKALVPEIREKWQAIITKTGEIDRQKAANSIKAIYAYLGKPEPKIIFCESPVVALRFLLSQLATHLELFEEEFGKPLGNIPKQQVWKPLHRQVRKQLGKSLSEALENQLGNEINEQLKRRLRSELSSHLWELVVSQLSDEKWQQIGDRVWRQITTYLNNCICPEFWATWGALFDFQISVKNGDRNSQTWQVFESLVSNCGWTFAFEKVCVLCDRPLKINFDNEQHLHALGEPAIQFSDGYNLYCYHGVPIPEKYGSKHPEEWQIEWYLSEPNIPFRRIIIEVIPPQKLPASWVLSEPNAELRRQLIQRIGYVRICQELQAEELDKYLEYTLLKINAEFDREPIHILKMICPSTGDIHALRVPPNMNSAREAIRWVNWGIDPEEFRVQT